MIAPAAIFELQQRIKRQLEGLHRDGPQWKCKCPAHRDNVASLAIKLGDDGRILLHCHAGCTTEAILRAWDVSWPELFPNAPRPANGAVQADEPEATYDYVDEQGALLFQVVRLPGKRFRQRRPLPDGTWAWNMHHTRRVLYHLDELQGAETVWLVEGEKDADRLRSLGLKATTAPMGAGRGKWRKDYAEQLRGKRVLQLADQDGPGIEYADEALMSLDGIADASRVELSPLPDPVPTGFDVSDWLDLGHTLPDLLASANTFSHSVPFSTSKGTEKTGWLLKDMTILSEPDDDPPELVSGGLCVAGGMTILGAKPKVGKSTLARVLALSVARGIPFLGREVRQGKAIYVALEEKRSEVKDHLRRLGAQADDPLYLVFQIEPRQALADLAAVIEVEAPALVVIDPLFRFVAIKDVADYAEIMNKLAPVLTVARSTGCHLFVTHHNTKIEREGADDLLGSTAIFGAVDTAIVYRRKADGTRYAYSVQRYGTDLASTVLNLAEDGNLIAAGDLEGYETHRAAAAILELVTKVGRPMAIAEITELLPTRKQRLLAGLNELIETARLSRSGTGVRGDPFKYRIAERQEQGEQPERPEHQEPQEPNWWQK